MTGDVIANPPPRLAQSAPPIDTGQRVARLAVIAGAALVTATWPAWTAESPLPAVPWLGWACATPGWIDGVTLAIAGLGAVLVLWWGGGPFRSGLVALTTSSAVLILLDQERLQPWAYEFVLIWTVVLLAPEGRSQPLLRWLIVSIYLHSALSKLDAAFLTAHGQLLLDGLLRTAGIDARLWSAAARRGAAAAFPIGELSCALLLAARRTRAWGLAASVVMHVVLLWTLGPWGLGHKPGVLLWNAYFIVQNIFLFRPATAPARRGSGDSVARCRAVAATALVALAAVLPLLESTGWWDHWPSWAVYSSRPAMVTMLVREARVGDLPLTLRSCVGHPEPLTDWRPVSIEAWAFERLRCPAYPQERYRLALIRAIAEQAELADDVRVRVESPPNRRTGDRTTLELRGLVEIRARCSAFWISTQSRRVDSSR